MQKLLKTISLLLVIAAVVFAAGCTENSGDNTEGVVSAEENAPEEENTTAGENNVAADSIAGEMPAYIVRAEAQFPPFEIVDPQGNIIGFDVGRTHN